jgi:hypothetical protein
MSVSFSSSRVSRLSIRSRTVDYYKLAKDVIDGKPPNEVENRDLRGVLVSLSVMRSEVTAAGYHDQADHIAGIIKQLNVRVQPPGIRRSSTRTATSISTEILLPVKTEETNQDDSLENFNEDELLEEVNVMLGQPGVDIEDDRKRRKILKVIAKEVDIAAKVFDLSRVEALHRLEDRVRYIPKPRISEITLRKDELETELTRLRNEEAQVQGRLDIARATQEKQADGEVEKKHEILQTEIRQIEHSSPQLEGKWTSTLLLLRDEEQRYAKDRDYYAAKTVHVRADERQAEEVKRRVLAHRLKVSRLLKQKTVEHEKRVDAVKLREWENGKREVLKDEIELARVQKQIRSAEIALDSLRAK